MYRIIGRLTLMVCVASLVVGCGPEGPTTYPVSGTVTLDGEPLTSGKVFLIDPAMKLAPNVGDIADGKFHFRATGGTKRVEISAARETGQVGNFGSPITEEALPARYNSESTLTAEVTTSGKDNKYVFKLEAD